MSFPSSVNAPLPPGEKSGATNPMRLQGPAGYLALSIGLSGLLLFGAVGLWQAGVSQSAPALQEAQVSQQARQLALALAPGLASHSSKLSNWQPLTQALFQQNPTLHRLELLNAEGDTLVVAQSGGLAGGSQAPQPLELIEPVRLSDGVLLGELHVNWQPNPATLPALAAAPMVWGLAWLGWLLTAGWLMGASAQGKKRLGPLVQQVGQLAGGSVPPLKTQEALARLLKSPVYAGWPLHLQLMGYLQQLAARLHVYATQSADTMAAERNKLEAVLLSIADGVIVCDHRGEAVIVNDPAAQMLGLSAADVLVGRSVADLPALDGSSLFGPLLETLKPARRKTDAKDGFTRPQPSATSRMIELAGITLKVTLSPIRIGAMQTAQPAAAGSPAGMGFVMILQDVTRETEVDKLKTNFISNVSHELRTPVTTIKSYVDTLFNHGDELDEPTRQEFIETIHIETDRLKKLVNDILDFSRLEEGVKLDKQWEDIAPIINLTVQSVRVLAQQKQLTLSTTIESGLPKVFLHSETVERVIRNLLSNAIKYTPEGGRIKVRAELSERGDQVEVLVQDTGIGIPEEHLPYIFDRFYRVENKVHTVKGTGLGLHLVKVAIEEHHGGQVFVKSKPDEGSTFGFRLPLALAANFSAQSASPQPEGWQDDLV